MFQADTARSRLIGLRIATLIGVLAGIGLTPMLWPLMPDAHAAILRLWVGTAIPVGIVCSCLLWTRLSMRLQELQTAAFAVVVALLLGAMVLSTRQAMPSLLFGGICLLIMLDVLAASFSFWLAVAHSIALTCIFGFYVQQMPMVRGLFGLVLLILMATCATFAVLGAWRVEVAGRRSYALMLRERLKQAALARRNTELDVLAQRDALTGLANRRAYEVWRANSWDQGVRYGVPLGLIIVDVDNFKLYNDVFGHAEGDTCLRQVGACLREHLRGTSDMVARLGGEEFVILLPGTTAEAALMIADRVREAVQALRLPHADGAAHPWVTVSCGVGSVLPLPHGSYQDLFTVTDAALYAAKRQGRNRACLADSWGAAAPTILAKLG